MSNWSLEVLKTDIPRGSFTHALFDFDGTLSLVREGWQQIMIPYFVDVLRDTPKGRDEENLYDATREFVDLLTGKQTIFQCIRLAEEVELRGGTPLEPKDYKDEYHNRLLEKIDDRLKGLADGSIDPEELRVPGTYAFLKELRARGVQIYLASGTDHEYVENEAALLGLTEFFDGGIYGARDDYKTFSKAMVIKKMIEDHNLYGNHLVGFGDGYVEIENIHDAGGYAVGVATDEARREGVDMWKRGRLINAGASIIIPDFSNPSALADYLFPQD